MSTRPKKPVLPLDAKASPPYRVSAAASSGGGRFELMLIGPRDVTWDACFIAEYPSVAAFVEMLRDPGYRVAVKHRQAACAGFATCPPDALRGGYQLLCAMKRQSSNAAAARGWSVSSGLMSAEA